MPKPKSKNHSARPHGKARRERATQDNYIPESAIDREDNDQDVVDEPKLKIQVPVGMWACNYPLQPYTSQQRLRSGFWSL